VQALMERTGARGHVTFGGRLAPDAKGFPASAMAKKQSGDWRNADQVRQGTQIVATQLLAAAAERV
jgi:menaquinone-dependent protoporphyrinogen oxidase